MALSEKALDYLEEQIPVLAEMALQKAYWQALASGDSVLIAENGQLIEVKPDGKKTVLKAINKPQIVQQRHFTIPKAWADECVYWSLAAILTHFQRQKLLSKGLTTFVKQSVEQQL